MGVFRIAGHEIPAPPLAAGLYVVATPIGNLGDISIRALETIAAASIIACEDKRITIRLLERYAIRAPMVAYHEHNADREGPRLLQILREGKPVALVSDAGTPLISDPGYRLVRAARKEGLDVFTVPGPSAAIAALSISGLPTDRFFFEGFLPARKAARRRRLQELTLIPATLILYESPERVAACLRDMADIWEPDREICLCREMTKKFEEVRQGTAAELAKSHESDRWRGEIVLLAGPPAAGPLPDADTVLRELLTRHNVSRAAAEAAELTGLPRRQLYQRALQLAAADREGGGRAS